jgi:hypothetical protein
VAEFVELVGEGGGDGEWFRGGEPVFGGEEAALGSCGVESGWGDGHAGVDQD